MDDDLFNVRDNEEEMLDSNAEEFEEEDLRKNDDVMEVDQEDEEDDDDDDEEDDDDDEDDDEDDEEEEANDDEKDDEEENDTGNVANEDDDDDYDGNVNDSRYIDAKETQEGSFQTKDDVMQLLRDDQREDEVTKENGDSKISEHHNKQDHDNHKDKESDNNHKPQLESEDKKFDYSTIRQKIISSARAATKFDIAPTVAMPYSGECHALAFSEGPRCILTGGEDGFIRKYDFIASIEGKLPLTMAQKHTLVDSVTKAGVIVSYWENEQPQTKSQILKNNPKLKASDFSNNSAMYEPKISPVYALDVNRNGYWCLSGSASGGISLYTMKYNEGGLNHYFMHGTKKQEPLLSGGHSDAISALSLNSEQDKFLSGSWDKTIREWDLNSGKCTNLFQGSTGQISNIQYRPEGLADFVIIKEDVESKQTPEEKTDSKQDGSDLDSLFGDSDDEDQSKNSDPMEEAQDEALDKKSQVSFNSSQTTTKYSNGNVFASSSIDGSVNIWDVRVHENNSNCVIRLGVPDNTPPWCMSSTWSNCGEYIYVGRRNSTVEEISLKMPHKQSLVSGGRTIMKPNVSKTLVFPKISGPISSLATMPNNDFLLCGSMDNIRLYNLGLHKDQESTTSKSKPPFMIIPGHHGGILSALWVDETGRFMVSASGNRGWGNATCTETVLIYEIDFN